MKIIFFGSYDKNFTSNKIVLDGLVENNVNVLEVNSSVKMTRLDKNEDMSWIKLINRVLKKWKIFLEIIKNLPGIASSNAIYIGFPGHFDVILAYPLAKIFRKKLIFNPIVIFYTGFVNDQTLIKKGSILAKVIKAAETIIYHMSDIILADTNLQKQHLMKDFGIPSKKIDILPIGADNKVYKYSPKKRDFKSFNVVYYGLYTPLHGVEYILDAAEICKKDKNIKFLMVGRGNTFEKNYEDAQKRKLNNIVFYPDMTEENAFETLSTGDIFLGFLQEHPSVHRIIPNKVYQGLALGKAVITADTPVMREVFENKQNIYLCKAASGESLANAIIELKNNDKMRLKIAENGYNTYKTNFTPHSIGKRLKEIVESF